MKPQTEKKYEILEDQITTDLNGNKLFRIISLKDFGEVKKGELGGFIKSEDNLSHRGKCWVGGDARVSDDATVEGNSIVNENAIVYGNAQIIEYARVSGLASIYGNAQVGGLSKVYERAKIFGNAKIGGNAEISDYAEIYGKASIDCDAKIYHKAEVYGNVFIRGKAEVFNYAEVYGSVFIDGNVKISGHANVFGHAVVGDEAEISGHVYISNGNIEGKVKISKDVEIKSNIFMNGKAIIKTREDFMLFDCIGSEDGTLTAFRTKKGIRVTRGCFSGSLKKFKKAVKEYHADNSKVLDEYKTIIKLIEKRLGGEK